MRAYKNNKSKSFLVPIVSLVIGAIVLISSISTYININNFEKRIQKEIKASKKEFLSRQTEDITKQVRYVDDSIKYKISQVEKQLEKELYTRMTIARSICDFVYNTHKDEKTKHQMRQIVAKQLSYVRFDEQNRGYYFAYQNSTRIVYEHMHKETIGKSMAKVTDTKGVNVALAHDKALEGGKEIGILKRYFYKPGNRKVGYPKLVTVTEYKPLDLLIGTGEYLDVIEKRLKKEVVDRYKNLKLNHNLSLAIIDLHDINGGKEFATVLLNTANKDMEGQKISDDYKDKKGFEFRKDYLKDLRINGYSYITHLYQKFKSDEQIDTNAYLYLQKDWNWIIVSSFYFDDLTKQIQALEDSLVSYKEQNIYDTLVLIFILSLIIICIAIVISLMIDNTIRKYTNEIIKNKNELEKAQEVAKMGSWYFDKKQDSLNFSSETYNIFQINKDKAKVKVGEFLEKFHDDDKKEVEKLLKDTACSKDKQSLIVKLSLKDIMKVVEIKVEKLCDENNTTVAINGTVQDITELYEKNEEIKDKERMLIQKEKLASMGEMIGNIAHQWRQPLSTISSTTTALFLKKRLNSLKDDEFEQKCKMIEKNVQYLSSTIDDFRNFIKGERVLKTVNLKQNIDSFLHLIEGTKQSNSIDIILDIDDTISIESYPNELIQCYLNIFNNSKDAFVINELEDRKIFITISKAEDKKVKIVFKDNAQGIAEDILKKVFEPYFTTKHQSQGTGLGLHMTYKFITEGMGGNISVSNTLYKYESKEYRGAMFEIVLDEK